MPLYRLIYASDTADYLDWNDLKDILLKSQENNAKLDVTGLLVMASGKFLQVLEGPAEPLNALYRKILLDARHRNSRLISYTPIHDRHFSAWAMRGINLGMMNPESKAALLDKYGADPDGRLIVPEDPFLSHSFLYDMYVDANA